jgi:hypothetical protein
MKKNNASFLDVFVVSGFIASFFNGFLNPLYVSLILSRLDGRVIAVGSFMSSAFPVLIGAMMGRPKIFARMYASLPWIMLVELAAAVASALIAAVDVQAYYLASMFVLGVFSSSVVYLMQRIKEVRYRRNRASFDRRYDMADACGLLAGSVVSVASYTMLRDPLTIAILGTAQTLVVYGLFLFLYRTVPARPKQRAAEEPHLCGLQRIDQTLLPCAA